MTRSYDEEFLLAISKLVFELGLNGNNLKVAVQMGRESTDEAGGTAERLTAMSAICQQLDFDDESVETIIRGLESIRERRQEVDNWARHSREMQERQLRGEAPLTPEVLAFLKVPNPTVTETVNPIALHTLLSLNDEQFEKMGADKVDFTSYIGCPWTARNLMFMRESGSIDDIGLESVGGGDAESAPDFADLMAQFRSRQDSSGDRGGERDDPTQDIMAALRKLKGI